MKAMIFAAGLGTRLKPYTLEHPKALVPVGGVPMLERVITKLKGIGVDEIVVNVHHFASQITDFLKANDNFGCTIHISDESAKLLDTGGGILAARPWLEQGDEPFIVHNADILTDFPIPEMINAHRQSDAVATLAVAERDTSRYLLFDRDMRMQGWTNITTGQVKPEGLVASGLERLAFAGVHVLSPKIFKPLSAFAAPGMPFPIMDFYISACTDINISGYRSYTPYHWTDIGKLDTLAQAELTIASQKQKSR